MNELTPDQNNALTGILEFIKTPVNEYKDCANILYAAAGCGKTYLTRHVADLLRNNYMIAGVAPTHKARKVLDKFLNEKSFYTIKTFTVASLLNKLKHHSYIGTKNYKGSGSKINLFDIFIIDEASMICDEDIMKIIEYAYQYKRKVLFVGDKYQIPNPVQKYIVKDGVAFKKDSIVFNIPGFELTTNLRQKENNPIIPLYLEFRNAIQENREANILREDKIIDGCGVLFYTEIEDWYSKIELLLNNEKHLHKNRVITYTNDSVKTHNQRIRKMYKRGIDPEVGEILMGYNNVGFPVPKVVNGQDYYILQIIKTQNYNILKFSNLVGLKLKMKECDTDVISTIFIPDVNSFKNQTLLQELIKRAEKVNKSKSTKNDYRKYFEIRNKLIFMDNIYKYGKEIVGESQFKKEHPLLFRRLNEVIDFNNHKILTNKLSDDIRKKYDTILEDRLNDDKLFSDVEKISDKLCIIEKDLDYGYAITAHKSQGSTYKNVFIDEYDFEKLKDFFNFRLGCEIKTTKEKNQLKYVSFTRPTNTAHVFYKEVV